MLKGEDDVLHHIPAFLSALYEQFRDTPIAETALNCHCVGTDPFRIVYRHSGCSDGQCSTDIAEYSECRGRGDARIFGFLKVYQPSLVWSIVLKRSSTDPFSFEYDQAESECLVTPTLSQDVVAESWRRSTGLDRSIA